MSDYSKIYSDDDSYFSGHGHAYEKLGVNPTTGCVVVIRPDQYVALVCELSEYSKLGGPFRLLPGLVFSC